MIEVYERHIADFVSLRLPVCPGVNALHRTFIRKGAKFATVIKSERYRKWLSEAGSILERQKPAQVPGAFGVRITVPSKARGDLDGFIKAPLDLLQAHSVIVNDRYCQRIEVCRADDDDMEIQISKTE